MHQQQLIDKIANARIPKMLYHIVSFKVIIKCPFSPSSTPNRLNIRIRNVKRMTFINFTCTKLILEQCLIICECVVIISHIWSIQQHIAPILLWIQTNRVNTSCFPTTTICILAAFIPILHATKRVLPTRMPFCIVRTGQTFQSLIDVAITTILRPLTIRSNVTLISWN